MGSPVDIVVLSNRAHFYAHLEKRFAKAGYHNLSLYRLGTIGVEVVFRSHPELVIVDGTLSSLEALEFCRQIKFHQCPASSSILFLTGPTESINPDLERRYCVDCVVIQSSRDLSPIVDAALGLTQVATHVQPLLFSFG